MSTKKERFSFHRKHLWQSGTFRFFFKSHQHCLLLVTALTPRLMKSGTDLFFSCAWQNVWKQAINISRNSYANVQHCIELIFGTIYKTNKGRLRVKVERENFILFCWVFEFIYSCHVTYFPTWNVQHVSIAQCIVVFISFWFKLVVWRYEIPLLKYVSPCFTSIQQSCCTGWLSTAQDVLCFEEHCFSFFVPNYREVGKH